jgi:hypothetical protein
MFDTPECRARLETYLKLKYGSAEINEELGKGTDGVVWATRNDRAAKVFHEHRRRQYENERYAYQHLNERGVGNKLGKFWIPIMRDFDDALMVIEMDRIHARPYIIDFAKTAIYRDPEFSDDVLELDEEKRIYEFGENWPAVQILLADLESYQIYYLDPNNHNIAFPDPDDPRSS